MTRDQIIAAHPILDFVRNRGHELSKAGQNFVTNGCPVTQHKKHHRPVTIDRENLWHCNDHDFGGTVIDWVMIEENVTAAEAMQCSAAEIMVLLRSSRRMTTLTKRASCFSNVSATSPKTFASANLTAKVVGLESARRATGFVSLAGIAKGFEARVASDRHRRRKGRGRNRKAWLAACRYMQPARCRISGGTNILRRCAARRCL